MIYLDNAATSFPKPPEVARAMTEHLTNRAVNPGRSGFDLALAAGRAVDSLRADLGRLCGNRGDDPGRTVFTANATAALNLAISGICRPGDHVVATVMEHNSVLRPLWMLREQGRITFDLAPADPRGLVDPAAISALVRPETRLVIASHASNVCGTIQPVAEIGAICRERELFFLLDAAQTAGLLDIDMAAMGVDAVALTGHKGLMGPTGTGALVVGPDADIASTVWGGTGVRSDERVHPQAYPYRLEAGTLNAAGLAGLAAGLAWVGSHGPRALLDRETRLASRLVAGCRNLDGVRVHGPHAAGAGQVPALPTVPLTLADRDPEALGLMLDADSDIAVRWGLQCAPLAHGALGTVPDGTVRVSFGPYNTEDDVDRLLAALREIVVG